MNRMTSRQRMLAAIRKQKPDRVPVAPDFSAMVPARLTGRGFYKVFIDEDPPLWRAYLDAVRHFGTDAWFTYGAVVLHTRDVEAHSRWIAGPGDHKIQEVTWQTPAGELTAQYLFTDDLPPRIVKRIVVDVDRDWPRLRYLFGEIVHADYSPLEQQRDALGDLGILGIGIATPGFQMWNDYFEGGIFTLTDLHAERPELLDELRELHHARSMDELDHYLKGRPDFILTGGSGSITMASPALWLKYSFPTLKEHCRLCDAAGVISMVHSCGKQKFMVETCVRETLLDCINPLEIPPMGDCDLHTLHDIVRDSRLSLMGNLHTTDAMLRGTPDYVCQKACEAIEAVRGWEGGFILSTGDQCGRDTPDENLFALVDAAESYRGRSQQEQRK